MPLSAYVNNFSLNTSTGNQSVTGVGFQPKANIFLHNRIDALISGERSFAQANHGFGVGLSSTSRAAISMNSQNGQASSVCDKRHHGSQCMTMLTSSGNADLGVDFVSQDSDGFTIDIDDASISVVTPFLSLGGTALEAELVEWTGDDATGNQNVACSFAPKVAITFTDTQTGLAADPASSADAAIMLGAADVDGNQWCTVTASDDAQATTETNSRMDSDKHILILDPSDGSAIGVATTSLTASGMTVNWTDASDVRFWTLFLGGNISYAVGVGQAPATDVSQEITVSEPQAMLIASHGSATLGSAVSNIRHSIGVSDGTRFGSIWMQDEDGQASSDTDRHIDTNSIIWFADDGQSLLGEATVSFGVVKATLDWTSMDGSQPRYGYVLLGNPPIPLAATVNVGRA